MNPYAGGTNPPGGAYGDGIYPGCGAGVVGKPPGCVLCTYAW